jgi:hypothetical protein
MLSAQRNYEDLLKRSNHEKMVVQPRVEEKETEVDAAMQALERLQGFISGMDQKILYAVSLA